MENSFKCGFDHLLVATHSECDRLSCKGNHNPKFNVYFQKADNKYCYCLNRQQLGQ